MKQTHESFKGLSNSLKTQIQKCNLPLHDALNLKKLLGKLQEKYERDMYTLYEANIKFNDFQMKNTNKSHKAQTQNQMVDFLPIESVIGPNQPEQPQVNEIFKQKMPKLRQKSTMDSEEGEETWRQKEKNHLITSPQGNDSRQKQGFEKVRKWKDLRLKKDSFIETAQGYQQKRFSQKNFKK